jgi:hypothetical protein
VNSAGGALQPSRTSNARVLDQLLIIYTVVYDNEPAKSFDVDTFSRRGAQHKITGYALSQGCEPPGRWESNGSILTRNSQSHTRFQVKKYRPDRRWGWLSEDCC